MIECDTQIGTTTASVICDTASGFVAMVSSSPVIAAGTGAALSFLLMYLLEYLRDRRQDNEHLKSILFECQDWLLHVASVLAMIEQPLKYLDSKESIDAETFPIVEEFPQRRHFFTELPSDRLNPLPKKLLLFQSELSITNYLIHSLNRKHSLIEQVMLARINGGGS